MSEPSPDPWSVASIEALAPDGKSITAARELLRAGDTFPQVEPTVDDRGWWAVCQGTTDLYRVAVRATEYGFAYECTCPSRKEPCKHAIALLLHLAEHPALRATAAPGTPSTRDFEGLLRAVFANPDDDTPRLIFADYLEEDGQSDRAALIRVECEWARLPEADTRAVELFEQEKELLDRIGIGGGLPEEFDIGFRRGFIQLSAGPEAFQSVSSMPASVANLFLAGWVESLQLRDRFGAVDVEAHALLRRAGELDFRHVRQGDVDLVRLALDMPVGVEGQRLARVRVHAEDEELFRAYASGTAAPTTASPPDWGGPYWSSRSVTPEHLERLLRAGRGAGVTQLTFYDSNFGDRGAAVLAAGDLTLEQLEFHGAGVGPAGAAALAVAAWFPRLVRLSVWECPFVNAGVAALGSGTGACALQTLRLSSAGVGDAGIAAFATSTRFPSLEEINLERNEITETGAAALLASERFPRLKRIELDRNPIPEEGRVRLALEARDRPELEVAFGTFRVTRTSADGAYRVAIRGANPSALAALVESSERHKVAALALEDATLTPEAAAGIAAALSPDVWRSVDLTGCSLGEKPVATVEKLITGHKLTTLDLTRTNLKYVDVFKLTLCPALASVKVLDLSANPMGTGGLEALLSSPHLRGVERFVLKELNLTQRDRMKYQKEFGPRAEF